MISQNQLEFNDLMLDIYMTIVDFRNQTGYSIGDKLTYTDTIMFWNVYTLRNKYIHKQQ